MASYVAFAAEIPCLFQPTCSLQLHWLKTKQLKLIGCGFCSLLMVTFPLWVFETYTNKLLPCYNWGIIYTLKQTKVQPTSALQINKQIMFSAHLPLFFSCALFNDKQLLHSYLRWWPGKSQSLFREVDGNINIKEVKRSSSTRQNISNYLQAITPKTSNVHMTCCPACKQQAASFRQQTGSRTNRQNKTEAARGQERCIGQYQEHKITVSTVHTV